MVHLLTESPYLGKSIILSKEIWWKNYAIGFSAVKIRKKFDR